MKKALYMLLALGMISGAALAIDDHHDDMDDIMVDDVTVDVDSSGDADVTVVEEQVTGGSSCSLNGGGCSLNRRAAEDTPATTAPVAPTTAPAPVK